MAPVKLLWRYDPSDTTKYWETDWLHYLFGQYVDIIDSGLSTPHDQAVVITSSLGPEYQEYFRSFEAQGYRYGIVLLSDEYLRTTLGQYPNSAQFIFRNYYDPKLVCLSNVHFFPLGYKVGFWDGYQGPKPDKLTQRPCVWSFAGCLRKSDRQSMQHFMTKYVDPGMVRSTSGWNSVDCLSTVQYRDLMLQSVFIPSPIGNASVDCFRTCEALEAGCIPIVPSQSDQGIEHYYTKLSEACGFTAPPFPEIEDWSEVEHKGNGWLKQAPRLRLKCYEWWCKFKQHIKQRFQVAVTGLGK